jgi:hypothetical protein
MTVANRYSFAAGTAGTVTVASPFIATGIRAIGAGTLVITPQGGSALPTITLSAASWFQIDFDPAREDFLPGTTFVFAGTSSYVVMLEQTGGV